MPQEEAGATEGATGEAGGGHGCHYVPVLQGDAHSEGIGAQQKVASLAGPVKGATMGFKKKLLLNNPKMMFRSEGYL